MGATVVDTRGTSSPSNLFLELRTEQQIGEEEDVPQLPRSLHHLHQKAVLQQLPALQHKAHVLRSRVRPVTTSSHTWSP